MPQNIPLNLTHAQRKVLAEVLPALADPKHEQHKEFKEWRGPFDSEAFDAGAATKEMRKGLPNWREVE